MAVAEDTRPITIRAGISRTGRTLVTFEWHHPNGKFQLSYEDAIMLAGAIVAEIFAAHYDAVLFTAMTALLDAENIGPPEERRALVAKLTTELGERRKESPLQ